MGREAREQFLTFATSSDALWPGNFRDFIAAIRRMATLCTGGRISVDDRVAQDKGVEPELRGLVVEDQCAAPVFDPSGPWCNRCGHELGRDAGERRGLSHQLSIPLERPALRCCWMNREKKSSSAEWGDVSAVRATIAGASRGELPRSLLGSFDPVNASHVATLLALESKDRRTLFDHGTWSNWGPTGINHGALYLADSGARAGRFADALTLLDDLVVTRHLPAQTYQLALWAIQNDNSKLGV